MSILFILLSFIFLLLILLAVAYNLATGRNPFDALEKFIKEQK